MIRLKSGNFKSYTRASKTFPMLLDSNQFPGSLTSKKHYKILFGRHAGISDSFFYNWIKPIFIVMFAKYVRPVNRFTASTIYKEFIPYIPML